MHQKFTVCTFPKEKRKHTKREDKLQVYEMRFDYNMNVNNDSCTEEKKQSPKEPDVGRKIIRTSISIAELLNPEQ